MRNLTPSPLHNLVRVLMLVGFACWSANAQSIAKADFVIGFDGMAGLPGMDTNGIVSPGSTFIEKEGFTLTGADAPVQFLRD
ncbi:MAG: hypothetical protein AB8B50_15405 [Pirellulaceae bacterium]